MTKRDKLIDILIKAVHKTASKNLSDEGKKDILIAVDEILLTLDNKTEDKEPIFYDCTLARFTEQLCVPLWKAMEFGKFFSYTHAQRKVEVGEIEKIIKDSRFQWRMIENYRITKIEYDKAKGQVDYMEFIKSEDYQKLAQVICDYVNKDYLQARKEKE